MERHSCLYCPVKCTKGVIFRVCEWFQLLIAIVVARIEALISVLCSHVEQWVMSRVPPSETDVKASNEKYLLVNEDHFCMMTPKLNGPA